MTGGPTHNTSKYCRYIYNNYWNVILQINNNIIIGIFIYFSKSVYSPPRWNPQKIMPLENLCFSKSRVPKMLCCQQCSTLYATIWINNSLKSILAIQENYEWSPFLIQMERKPSVPTSKSTLFAVSKRDAGKSIKNA